MYLSYLTEMSLKLHLYQKKSLIFKGFYNWITLANITFLNKCIWDVNTPFEHLVLMVWSLLVFIVYFSFSSPHYKEAYCEMLLNYLDLDELLSLITPWGIVGHLQILPYELSDTLQWICVNLKNWKDWKWLDC